MTPIGEGEFLCSLMVVRLCATPSSYLLLVSDLQPPESAANSPHRVIFKAAAVPVCQMLKVLSELTPLESRGSAEVQQCSVYRTGSASVP